MIAMDGERKVVELSETRDDQSGYVTLYQGAPFSGLLVEVSSSNEVVCAMEFVEGRPHGYAVDYLGGRPTSVDEYNHGTLHGLSATWKDGRLSKASRFQHDVENQRLLPDGSVEEPPETTARIARIHASCRDLELLSESVGELLARFELKCDSLLFEARRSLGLA